jgi:ribosomal peptide maturation radical SAM protein 1
MHNERHSVLLIAMPYAGVMIPSIQLPILEAYCRNNDIDIKTRHLYLKAAEIYGLAQYHALIYPPGDSYTAQMAFSRYLFPDHWQKNQDKIKAYYTKTILKQPTAPSFDDYLQRTDTFYNWMLDHLDWQNHDLIGFTLNYGQLIPSLAIARHIKTQDPDKKIIFGGSRTFGDLGCGILQAFPYIDYIVSGDGEQPLLQLAHNEDPTIIPGLIYRKDNKVLWNKTRIDIDLAISPIPTYDSFFDQLKNSSSEIQQFFAYSGRLPVEISRGCWWNHCTFCNLNLQHPCYREKPTSKIINEIQYLSDRYHILDFHLIGNTLPKSHYRELFTSLNELGKDCNFFVEVRAGHLTSTDYQLMKEAGFNAIQTGIESFSAHHLKTMNKGTRVIDNIAALKHTRQYGIHNSFNLIVRYPNESPLDFTQTQDVTKHLQAYLDPPQLCPLQIMHGSPIQQHPNNYNIQNLQPTTLDLLLYPPEILSKHFSFYYDYTTVSPVPTHDWEKLIQDWKQIRESAEKQAISTHTEGDNLVFYSVDGGTFMKVYDKRDRNHIRILELNELERKVLLACNDVISYEELQRQFAPTPEFMLAAIIQSFEHAGLVFHEDNHYLSLPLQYRTTTQQQTQHEKPSIPQVLAQN